MKALTKQQTKKIARQLFLRDIERYEPFAESVCRAVRRSAREEMGDMEAYGYENDVYNEIAEIKSKLVDGLKKKWKIEKEQRW